MNCNAPLDDDTPFPADDELFPSPGTTPRDAGCEDGGDSLFRVVAIALLLGIVAAMVVCAVGGSA